MPNVLSLNDSAAEPKPTLFIFCPAEQTIFIFCPAAEQKHRTAKGGGERRPGERTRRAICLRKQTFSMVWSQIGNFSPAAHLLSGVPPEPRRLACYSIGARAKKRRKTAGSSRAGHLARNIPRPRNILPWLKPAKWFPWPRPRQSGLSGRRSKREIFGKVAFQKPKS